ncbi:MAG: (2Fe-2S)-binding protein [Pseudomonadota bacterium]
MYVCLCNAVTESKIQQYISSQSNDVKLKGLKDDLGVCGQCGKCGKYAQSILKNCQQNTGE